MKLNDQRKQKLKKERKNSDLSGKERTLQKATF